MSLVRAAVGILLVAGGATAAAEVAIDRTAAPAPQDFSQFNGDYDGLFQFVRIHYDTGRRGFGGFGRGGREPPPMHDWPRAERNFLKIIEETTNVGTQTESSNVLRLDDPEIFKYPVLYIVEVGWWQPTDEEVENLREHLLKGGLLIVDDTRDDRGCCPAFARFEETMARVLPGLNLVEISDNDKVFDSFFRITPSEVIPPYGRRDPTWHGIYENNDRDERLLVIFNYNNDIAEYWEYSDRGWYPINLSNEAYKLGVNFVVYGLTH